MNALFATRDEGIAQLVGVMVGEQSLESGVDGVDVRVLRLLEVDIRKYPPEHGRERNGTGDFASAHFGLTRGAGQYFVFDADTLQFRTPQTEV
mgnify:CR=1 FL=1